MERARNDVEEAVYRALWSVRFGEGKAGQQQRAFADAALFRICERAGREALSRSR